MAAYVLLGMAGARFSGMVNAGNFIAQIFVYPVALLFGMSTTDVVAGSRPPGEKTNATATPPKWHLRYVPRRLFATATVPLVILGVSGWWISHPIDREILKLDYGNRTAQETACMRLRLLGSDAEDALPALVRNPLTGDPDWGETLLNIGTVPALNGALKSAYSRVRALSALGEMGSGAKDSVPALTELLESGLDYRQSIRVVRTLGQIGPDAKEAIPDLVKFGNAGVSDPADHSTINGRRVDPIEIVDPMSDVYVGRWVPISRALEDIGLEHLKGLPNPQVPYLWLGDTTDDILEHLRALPALRVLRLDGHKGHITDAGLVHLKGLTNLKKLRFRATDVTDAGLEHLKELTNLEQLAIYCPQITDAGLTHLEGLTGLRRLDLRNTKVTNAGLERLRAALPNCDIGLR